MTTVEVFIDAAGAPRLVGQVRVARARGRVSTTFLYDPAYLADGGANLDPALLLAPGAQHQDGPVRVFADSAPDRWWRNLIRKAERSRAREEGRVPRRLDDLDFLLGAGDGTRQGALRFRLLGHDEFLGEPSRIPRLIALPELLRAGDALASDDDPSDALKRLLDTGTTGLGGARPKASVRLDDGGLAVEGLLVLAEDCGLTVRATRRRMSDIAASLAHWRERARSNRIPEREIVMMAESIGPRLEAVARAGRGAV